MAETNCNIPKVVLVNFGEREIESRSSYLKKKIEYFRSLCADSNDDVVLKGFFFRKDLELLSKELNLELCEKDLPISGNRHTFFMVISRGIERLAHC